MEPDFANLTFFELLFLLTSLPGMLLWAKVVTDAVRNMIQGGPKLTPLGQQLGVWLRARSPLQMQEIIIGLIALLPVLAYITLAVWVDASLRSVEQVYEFLKWVCVAQVAAAAYYQFVKAKDQPPQPAVVMPSPSFDLEALAREISARIGPQVVDALLANNAIMIPK